MPKTRSDPSTECQSPDGGAERKGRWRSISTNLGLGAFIVYECAIGLAEAKETYDQIWWLLVTPILFINVLRRGPAIAVDRRWLVVLICWASTFHFLAFEGDDERWWAEILLIGIILLGDLNLIYLGRSFSILPARREIRCGFAYRFVRHPVYATYIVSDLIFVVLVPTPRNLTVLLAAILLWALRTEFEERLLREDPNYREYAAATPWRLIPGIW